MSEEDFRKIAKEYAEMYFTKGIKYVDELEKKVEQLENIRKEAIEYIKENLKSYSLPNTIKDMRYIDFYKLLDILNKGYNKE